MRSETSIKHLFYISVALIVIPLFFIGLQSGHDWGDDFALYIKQALSIASGESLYNTNYVFNEKYFIGPKFYPMGFPILLSPIVYFFGNNINILLWFISLLYCAMALLVAVYYKKHFSNYTTLVMLVVLLYNALMLQIKQQVLTEIPFTILILALLLHFNKKRETRTIDVIVRVLLISFLFLIRTLGIALIGSLLVYYGVLWLKKQIKVKDLMVCVAFYAVIPILVYFIVHRFVFSIHDSNISQYSAYFFTNNIFETISHNLHKYLLVFFDSFTANSGAFKGIALAMSSGLFVFACVGFVRTVLSKIRLDEIFFVAYFAAILLYHDADSAFRFMFPIYFLIVFYAVVGFKYLILNKVSNRKAIVSLKTLVLILFILIYVPGVKDLCSQCRTVPYGPQSETAIEFFDYANNNIDKNSLISFAKPRAMALYSEPKYIVEPREKSGVEIFTYYYKNSIDYVLVNQNLSNPYINKWIQAMGNRCSLVWNNDEFYLYKIITVR
ncbi:MAG: hypothetical protein WBH98_02310 [Bacteroidales bacterium]